MPFIPDSHAGRGKSRPPAGDAPRPQSQPLNGAAVRAPSGSLFSSVAQDLAAVEDAIQAVANVENALLGQTLRLILSAGGKRVRPALVLLASGTHEPPLHRRVALAVAAELLHTATLVHDDVLDTSAARRGQPTINAAFSNTLAVLTGDYLFGKSGELVASLDNPAIMGVFSWAVMELVKGEMLRPSLDGDLAATERDYLAKINGKTASLFAMCCQTGAMLDADDPDLVRRLLRFGTNLGMAFQIADDVLDYAGTEEQLGKPVGSDLRQGTITLPAIYYLRRAPADRLLLGFLTHDDAVQERAGEAVALVRQSGAVDEALDRAREYATAALASLDGLPDTPHFQALRHLTRYVVDRRE